MIARRIVGDEEGGARFGMGEGEGGNKKAQRGIRPRNRVYS